MRKNGWIKECNGGEIVKNRSTNQISHKGKVIHLVISFKNYYQYMQHSILIGSPTRRMGRK